MQYSGKYLSILRFKVPVHAPISAFLPVNLRETGEIASLRVIKSIKRSNIII